MARPIEQKTVHCPVENMEAEAIQDDTGWWCIECLGDVIRRQDKLSHRVARRRAWKE